ncbi:homeotic protein female sterile [Frankliniella occidentalis]|uniref:Homeotic protein female sterile n=1 Tax=Frankliniella occidentalis TaxID=133901 RepID=A0A6J1S5K3_FRAOC|nr:homeotic protein female sterile [Frankliniella occidentalis]
MRPVKLDDLISVPIDWRMLTTLRPRTKMEEEFFSRLIELGKLTRATLQFERQREGPRSTYAATSSSWVKRFKSRSGVVETKATTCSQCGDEFCDSTACKLFTYDCFVRSSMLPGGAGGAGDKGGSGGAAGAGDKGAGGKDKAGRKKRRRAGAKSAKAPSSQPASRRASPSKKTRSAGGGGGGGGGGGRARAASEDRRRDASRHRSASAPPASKRAASRGHSKSAKK